MVRQRLASRERRLTKDGLTRPACGPVLSPAARLIVLRFSPSTSLRLPSSRSRVLGSESSRRSAFYSVVQCGILVSSSV